MSYVEHQLRHLVGKAISTYGLIKNNDRILLGLSGKDSLVMLLQLTERLAWVPIHYEVFAVHVDLGLGKGPEELMNTLQGIGINCRVIHTNIGNLAHSEANKENPCFLCSWERRKLLFKTASDMGCNKIALGHNKDDVINTFFLNLFYSARAYTMEPIQEFFGGELTVIRPLYLVERSIIDRYLKSKGIFIEDSPCPSAKVGKRAEINSFMQSLYLKNKDIKGNIFTAITKLIGKNFLK